ncbi:Nephrin [Folsomia candida]|uniref:Nephrin n=1 Tax=Folsomia candida TaxID=158441 RepID=A0A226CTM0_FOLCA|nr:Nephrin [Folsomia candida]
MCLLQVSTGTGIVSYLVHLHIAVPESFILGNGEYHIEQGSTINLVCVIEKSPKPPEYIFWYHNDRMINYGNSREVTVQTEPGSKTQSRLTIRNAQLSDTGNYSCTTPHAVPASTLVYVSQGDQIAAIQKRKAAADSAAAASSASASASASTTSTATAYQANHPFTSLLVLSSITLFCNYATNLRSYFAVPLILSISTQQQNVQQHGDQARVTL